MISLEYNNLLLDKLPITINGLKINTNFRNSILFELLMQDVSLTKEQKIMQAINIYFEDFDTLNNAIDSMLIFFNCGIENTEKEPKNSKAIYSFEHDATHIFSAFLSQYQIDLNSIKYLHWWKFRALFNNLNEDHLFSKIMSYRAMDLSKIKDREQRKYYRELQIKYRLPDNRTRQEKEREFANALG